MKYFIKVLVFLLLVPINIVLNYYPVYASTTKVRVTEKIPWVPCSLVKWSDDDVETKTYDCEVESWFDSFLLVIQWLIKYFLFIAVLVVVLMIAASWVRMSIQWKNDAAKKQFIHLIEAIVLIFFMWLILNSVAPWVYK